MLGAKANPYPYIKNADIYVQTSRHEGYCLTLAEAKCLCKPIVTTNFIGAYEQIENDVNGLITEANDKDIYESMLKLINNENLRNIFVNKLINDDISTELEINKLYKVIEQK